MKLPKSQVETDKIYEAVKKALPPIFARHSLSDLTGGLIHSRTLANKMAKGEGPPAIRYGRKIGFIREAFMDWLREEDFLRVVSTPEISN